VERRMLVDRKVGLGEKGRWVQGEKGGNGLVMMKKLNKLARLGGGAQGKHGELGSGWGRKRVGYPKNCPVRGGVGGKRILRLINRKGKNRLTSQAD